MNEEDVPSLPVATLAELLKHWARVAAKGAAAHAGLVGAFHAGSGPRADGQRSVGAWLSRFTRCTPAAGRGQVAAAFKFRRHPHVRQALADGTLTESYGRWIAEAVERFPAEDREAVEGILVEAASSGATLDDLVTIATAALRRLRPSGLEDEAARRHGERNLTVSKTLGGAGRINGDLTAEATALTETVIESLAVKAGPEDTRTKAQRRHDALVEAFRRLTYSGLLPERGGSKPQVKVDMDLATLLSLPGSAQAEEEWIEHATAQLTRDRLKHTGTGTGTRANADAQAEDEDEDEDVRALLLLDETPGDYVPENAPENAPENGSASDQANAPAPAPAPDQANARTENATVPDPAHGSEIENASAPHPANTSGTEGPPASHAPKPPALDPANTSAAENQPAAVPDPANLSRAGNAPARLPANAPAAALDPANPPEPEHPPTRHPANAFAFDIANGSGAGRGNRMADGLPKPAHDPVNRSQNEAVTGTVNGPLRQPAGDPWDTSLSGSVNGPHGTAQPPLPGLGSGASLHGVGPIGNGLAGALACDSVITPVVTAAIDLDALAKMTEQWLAHYLPRHPAGPTSEEPWSPNGDRDHRCERPPGEAAHHAAGGSGGPPGRSSGAVTDVLGEEHLAELHRGMLRWAIQVLSGPGGLASYLRTRRLAGPLATPSIVLDAGADGRTVPAALERLVRRRDRQCRFPGCDHPAALSQVHHITPRSRNGPTALWNLLTLCSFHHLIAVHTWGWNIRLNADGTTTATAPDGRTLNEHDPPRRAA
ncbi:HNH endonuclease signature motif containing protein [Actinomadura alba]|uniref:HNH endonuclease signature motif containing protein n=1 Tax=Actinomadura alba TaxID=406431 RepID=UPI00164F4F9D|nr:HNH endonuclease signature motif containing protein [Actinomadura alba]